MIEITFSGWTRREDKKVIGITFSSFKFQVPGGGRNHFFESLFAERQKVIQKSDSSCKFKLERPAVSSALAHSGAEWQFGHAQGVGRSGQEV